MSGDEGKRGDLEFGTVPRMLARSAERFSGSTALEDGEVTFTYGELRERALDLAAALLARGLQRGDRVAVWAPNIWEWAVAALGVLHVGGVLVPVNTRYRGHEAAYLLEKSGARLLFTVTDFLSTDYVALLREAEASLPALEGIVVLRGPAPEGTTPLEAFIAEGRGVSREAVEARGLEVKPEDPVDILFTSGTTGKPKGVVCTHAQNLRATRDWADVTGLREGDRYLVVLPFFHSFGYKFGLLVGLTMGATVMPEAVFDAGVVLERVQRDRVQVLPGPPALYRSILLRDDLGEYDLSSLRLAVTGADIIPVQLILDMRAKLGFETVITGYGLTESTGIVTMCRYDDEPQTIAETSGRAIPGVEVEIHDPEGRPLPPNTPGEIVVRGYNVTQGYFEAPEATAEAIDERGFLHTGDVGTLDERGYIRITDRMKDMFIVGGFNAYPAEIEGVLTTHPKIAEAAVIGVPDTRLGEVGVAFVVPRAGELVDEAEVIEFCKARLANFKVPRRVKFIDALPRNATGKVTKFALRSEA